MISEIVFFILLKGSAARAQSAAQQLAPAGPVEQLSERINIFVESSDPSNTAFEGGSNVRNPAPVQFKFCQVENCNGIGRESGYSKAELSKVRASLASNSAEYAVIDWAIRYPSPGVYSKLTRETIVSGKKVSDAICEENSRTLSASPHDGMDDLQRSASPIAKFEINRCRFVETNESVKQLSEKLEKSLHSAGN